MTTISNLEAHGIPVTAGGQVVKTTTVVQNVDQLRSLLDHGLDEAGREAHYQALFGGISPPPLQSRRNGAAPAPRGARDRERGPVRRGQGTSRRRLPDDRERHRLAGGGPADGQLRYYLSSASGPTIVTFTDVILEQGGYFVCDGTLLSFTCNTLTRNGNSGTPARRFQHSRQDPCHAPDPGGSRRCGPGRGREQRRLLVGRHRRPRWRTGQPGRPGNPGNHRHPRRHGSTEPGRDDQDPDGAEQPDQHLLAVRKRRRRRQRRPRRHRSAGRQRRQRRHL